LTGETGRALAVEDQQLGQADRIANCLL
jgi:hypothetical protein